MRVGIEVLTAVVMKSSVCWNITRVSLQYNNNQQEICELSPRVNNTDQAITTCQQSCAKVCG
jgi:hypothetical protein